MPSIVLVTGYIMMTKIVMVSDFTDSVFSEIREEIPKNRITQL